jgi:hypothetical protein
MKRHLASAGLVLGLVLAPTALAQTAPAVGIYEGTLIVTAAATPTGACPNGDPSTGGFATARLNNSLTASLDFAIFRGGQAGGYSIPWTTPGTLPASGSLSWTQIGGNGTVSTSTLSYSGAAIATLDATNGVLAFTIAFVLPDTCQVTLGGSFKLRSAAG